MKQVDTAGNNYLSKEKIIAIAKIPIGENIFLIDLDEVKSRFSQIIQIEKIGLRRKLPGRIIIDIKERKPFAIAVIGGQATLVDSEGFILAKQTLGSSVYKVDIARLPVIRGINDKSIEEGKRLGPSDRIFMKDTLNLLSGFLDPSTIQIEVGNRAEIVLFIEDILKVKIGAAGSMDRKIRVLQALLDSIKGKLQKVEYVDVRIPDNPVIKLK